MTARRDTARGGISAQPSSRAADAATFPPGASASGGLFGGLA